MKKILFSAMAILLAATVATAQDKGQWGVGPKISVYTNAGAEGAIFGIGAVGRYSFTDNLRIEPSIVALCHNHCSIDLSADMQYLFNVADSWTVYPLAGLSVNEIGDWSCGINLGAGTDFSLTRDWDLTASVKWMVQTAAYHKNPIVFSIGAAYKF